MTTAPPGEPSPRALSESLAALAAQLADLRGQIRAINERLDQAGLHPGLNLAGRFEDLAQTVAGTLDAASPRGPAAPYWIGLDRDTYHAQLADLRRWADTVLRPHYGGYELAGLLAPPHPGHLGTVHPGRRMAPHLQRDAPRPRPRPGVLRPVAARHYAPHHPHHPHMHAALRDAPQPRRLGCSSWIPLTPALRRIPRPGPDSRGLADLGTHQGPAPWPSPGRLGRPPDCAPQGGARRLTYPP